MITTMRARSSDAVLCGARCSGSSGEAIIFVHGVGSTAAIWDYQLAEFGRAYRCYAVELRGNGATGMEPPPSAITGQGFVEDVLAVAREAAIERFHFIGCSLGGVVAFELWQRIPERVVSFVLIGAFAAYPDGGKTASAISAAALQSGDMRVFAEARAKRLFSPNVPPRRYRETIEQMAAKDLRSYVAATEVTWTGDYRSILPTIAVPTLVMCGDSDLIAPLHLSQEIADAVPGAELRVVKGAGHVANADRPKEVNALIAGFLSKVPP